MRGGLCITIVLYRQCKIHKLLESLTRSNQDDSSGVQIISFSFRRDIELNMSILSTFIISTWHSYRQELINSSDREIGSCFAIGLVTDDHMILIEFLYISDARETLSINNNTIDRIRDIKSFSSCIFRSSTNWTNCKFWYWTVTSLFWRSHSLYFPVNFSSECEICIVRSNKSHSKKWVENIWLILR